MRWVGIAAFSSLTGLTFYLGTWQLRRYYWKQALVDERQALLEAPPVELPRDLAALDDDRLAELERRRVALSGGHFDDARIALIGPRNPPKDMPPHIRGPDRTGYAVVMVYVRPDGSRIMVNRGWMPRTLAEDKAALARVLRHGGVGHAAMSDEEAAAAGPPAVSGIVTRGETANDYSPTNDHNSGEFMWIQAPAVAQYLGVPGGDRAIVVDAIKEQQVGGFPVTQQLDTYNEFYVTPFKHLVYCATWFALSVAGVVLTYVRFRNVNTKGVAAASKRAAAQAQAAERFARAHAHNLAVARKRGDGL